MRSGFSSEKMRSCVGVARRLRRLGGALRPPARAQDRERTRRRAASRRRADAAHDCIPPIGAQDARAGRSSRPAARHCEHDISRPLAPSVRLELRPGVRDAFVRRTRSAVRRARRALSGSRSTRRAPRCSPRPARCPRAPARGAVRARRRDLLHAPDAVDAALDAAAARRVGDVDGARVRRAGRADRCSFSRRRAPRRAGPSRPSPPRPARRRARRRPPSLPLFCRSASRSTARSKTGFALSSVLSGPPTTKTSPAATTPASATRARQIVRAAPAEAEAARVRRARRSRSRNSIHSKPSSDPVAS